MSFQNYDRIVSTGTYKFLGVFAIYYRCPRCGEIYYSAAKLTGEQLICEKCGATIEPIKDLPLDRSSQHDKPSGEKENKNRK